ncbi:MAG: hypothetical protein Q7T11_09245, partial [Deltaproteobacteria bacterium]|nr:hypothetical protein [Deltaproteobacteria bacterium]
MGGFTVTTQTWQTLEKSGLLAGLNYTPKTTGEKVEVQFGDPAHLDQFKSRFGELKQTGYFFDYDQTPRNGTDAYLAVDNYTQVLEELGKGQSPKALVTPSQWSVVVALWKDATIPPDNRAGQKQFLEEKGVSIRYADKDGKPDTMGEEDWTFLPTASFEEIDRTLNAPSLAPDGGKTDAPVPATAPAKASSPTVQFFKKVIVMPGKLEDMKLAGLLEGIDLPADQIKEEKGEVTLTFKDEDLFRTFASNFKKGRQVAWSGKKKFSEEEVQQVVNAINGLYWGLPDDKNKYPGIRMTAKQETIDFMISLGITIDVAKLVTMKQDPRDKKIKEYKDKLKTKFRASLVRSVEWTGEDVKKIAYTMGRKAHDAIYKDNEFAKIKAPIFYPTLYGRVRLLEESAPWLKYYTYEPLLVDSAENLVPVPMTLAENQNPFDQVKPDAYEIMEGEYRAPDSDELKEYLKKPGMMPEGVAATLENLPKSRIRITRDKNGNFFPVLATFSLDDCELLNTPKDPTLLDLPFTEEQAYALGAYARMPKDKFVKSEDDGTYKMAFCKDGDVSAQKGATYYRLKNPPKISDVIKNLERLIQSATGNEIELEGITIKKTWAEQLLEKLKLLNEKKGPVAEFVDWLMATPVGNLVLQGGVTGSMFVIAGATLTFIILLIYGTPWLGRKVMKRVADIRGTMQFLEQERVKEEERKKSELRDMDVARSSLKTYTDNMVDKALDKDRQYPPMQGVEEDLKEGFRQGVQKGKTSFVWVGPGGGGKSARLEAAATEIAKRRKMMEIRKKENREAKNKDFWSEKNMQVHGIVPEAKLTSLCPAALANMKLYMLDMQRLVGGTSYRGMLEDRIKDIVLALSENPALQKLAIEEIADQFNAGKSEGGEGGLKMMKPALADGRVGVWGVAVEEDWNEKIGIDSQDSRRLPKIRIKDLPRDVVLRIIEIMGRAQMQHLRDLNPEDKEFAKIEIVIDDKAKEMIMEQAATFYDQAEPDRSMDLVKRLVTEMYMEWDRAREAGTPSTYLTTVPADHVVEALRGKPAFIIKEDFVERYANER